MPGSSRRPSLPGPVGEFGPLRFAAGWRQLAGDDVTGLEAALRPSPELEVHAGPDIIKPSILVDVVRPSDLVAFTVEGYDLELVTGEEPHLRAKAGKVARLAVVLPFQHMAEQAIYETPARVPVEGDPTKPPVVDPQTDPPGAMHVAPIPARPAKASRLVFEVPEGEQILFSVAGILDALKRLRMAVHPLATPRYLGLYRESLPITEGPTLHLPGGLVATVGPAGVAIASAADHAAAPDSSTATGLSALARDARRVRALMAVHGEAPRELAAFEPAAAGPTTSATAPTPAARDLRLGGRRFRIPPLLSREDLTARIPPFVIPTKKRLSRPAKPLETALEAPYRLVVSPSERGGWTHADEPVAAQGAAHRVELWHSRLGVRVEHAGERVSVDERPNLQRTIRAIWARDREKLPGWETLKVPLHQIDEFRSSLDGADRHMLVRQSSETWLGKANKALTPTPVNVERLWVSALGAWLDLHGAWTTRPYSEAGMSSILFWDHIAPMGRDQYVRVVYPGYLYPFGHKATLVKLTERKMKSASPSTAGLFQRMFIVIGEPTRHYDQRDLPLEEVRLTPLVTPTLDDPGAAISSFFVPSVGGQEFPFVLHTHDREGRAVRLSAPLMWVAEQVQDFAAVNAAYNGTPRSRVGAGGQQVAYAPVAKGGDTLLPTRALRFEGAAALGTSRPRLGDAEVTLPAAEKLSPVGPVTIGFATPYLSHGFGGAQNAGEVWAELKSAVPTLSFGGGGSSSDKAGGFLQPDLPIRGLSRASGLVGDVAGMATKSFDPTTFLAGALPKLFGLVPLIDLIEAVVGDLSKAPNVVSQALDRIEGFLADLERAKQTALDAVADAQRLVDRAASKVGEVQSKAADALAAAQNLEALVTQAVDQLVSLLSSLVGAAEDAVESALAAPLDALKAASTQMRAVAPKLPPLVRNQLLSVAAVLDTALQGAELISDVFRFLNGLASGTAQVSFRFEWRPKVSSWPSAAAPVLELKPDSLVLAVDGRASGKDGAGVEVLAELRDFALHLLPGKPLVRFRFDHLSFRAGSAGKAEVDVVLQEIEFVGVLGFVEVLKDLIPFDGFSDPPYLDVDASGLVAGFTLDLPNVAVGVFSLSNMSLGADIRVPFLGDVVTVGFNFCTRERPFNLSVLFIGGGGWFGLRLSPDGLDLLELGLEAGATLSVDLGVASGSISAMIGVYIRLEGDTGSLTGYFRLRGEVSVLGLISASIELYLELHYEFDTGKMVGRASLTVKVDVFFFSISVTIACERRFAGSNGDPTFLDVMGLDADGTSAAWSEYCLAFAGA